MDRRDHEPEHALPRRPSAADGRAFSLVELTVILVIAGIMAAVAAPALSGMGRSRQAAAASRLAHDLAYARQYAVATGTRTWVAFDLAGGQYRLLAEDPASPGRPGAVAMTGSDGAPLTVDLMAQAYAGSGFESVWIDAGTEVGFDWLGAPLNSAEAALAADGVITLTGGAEARIAAVTGQITLVAP